MSLAAMSWAWEQAVKPASAKLVLLCLADRHNGSTGQCNPSVARIAEQTGLDRKAVMSGLKKLEFLGLVSAQKKQGARNAYSLRTSTETGTGSKTPKAQETSTGNGTSPKNGTSTENGTLPVPKTGPEPVPKTGHEPVRNQERTEKEYVFKGETIAINAKDFAAMSEQYTNLDLMDQLGQLDLELRGKKSWWHPMHSKLNYRNQKHEKSGISVRPSENPRRLSPGERVRQRRAEAAERQARATN